jgi:hypothetical protein
VETVAKGIDHAVDAFIGLFPRAKHRQDGGRVGLSQGVFTLELILNLEALTRRFGTFTAVDPLPAAEPAASQARKGFPRCSAATAQNCVATKYPDSELR